MKILVGPCVTPRRVEKIQHQDFSQSNLRGPCNHVGIRYISKIPLIDRYIPSLKLQHGEITDVQIYFEN